MVRGLHKLGRYTQLLSHPPTAVNDVILWHTVQPQVLCPVEVVILLWMRWQQCSTTHCSLQNIQPRCSNRVWEEETTRVETTIPASISTLVISSPNPAWCWLILVFSWWADRSTSCSVHQLLSVLLHVAVFSMHSSQGVAAGIERRRLPERERFFYQLPCSGNLQSQPCFLSLVLA